MKRGFAVPLIFVLALILALVGFFGYKLLYPNPATAPAITKTNNETPPNIPPLWPGVEWEGKTLGKYIFPDSSRGPIERNGYALITTAKVAESVALKFLNYYEKELNQYGWSLDDMAGGFPGDQVLSYKKNNQYFVYRTKLANDRYSLIVTYSQ